MLVGGRVKKVAHFDDSEERLHLGDLVRGVGYSTP